MNKEKAIKILEEYKKTLGTSPIETKLIARLLRRYQSNLTKKINKIDGEKIVERMFRTTMKTLYNIDDKELNNIYKIYFIDCIIYEIKEQGTEAVIPVFDDFTVFYIYADDGIFEANTNGFFTDFYHNLEEIKEFYKEGVKDARYKEALEIKEKFKNGEYKPINKSDLF